MYGNGIAVALDIQQAVALGKRAADGREPCGWNILGWAYKFGRGVPEDLQRAGDFYEKSCDAGSMFGCMVLGDISQ